MLSSPTGKPHIKPITKAIVALFGSSEYIDSLLEISIYGKFMFFPKNPLWGLEPPTLTIKSRGLPLHHSGN